MRIKRLMLLAATTAMLFGCRYGMTVESFPPARTPKGTTSHITTDRGRFSGELIEVRDDGIVIQTDRTLRLVLYAGILSSQFDGMSSRVSIKDRKPPSAESRETLRLVSRFPPGLTPEMLQRLLQANGQTSLARENP